MFMAQLRSPARVAKLSTCRASRPSLAYKNSVRYIYIYIYIYLTFFKLFFTLLYLIFKIIIYMRNILLILNKLVFVLFYYLKIT
jgi:hypothetical protein